MLPPQPIWIIRGHKMATQIFSKAVGIDLGTTNSAVAVLNPTDTDIVIHRDKTKRETTPSCVWKDPKTGEIKVGSIAFRRRGSSPAPVRSIKRHMGEQITVDLSGERKSPEQISAYILGEMKRQIEEDVANFNTESSTWIVDRAIVTVPAYFDQPQIEATRKAGIESGLEIIDLLHEPTAAACYHCWRTGIRNGLFLVYDLGGGTFDVTVLRTTEGAFEVLGISGNRVLGGDDIDSALAEHLQERLLADNYAMELDLRTDEEDKLRFEQLRLLAEGVKKGLSNAGEFVLRDSQIRDKDGTMVAIDTTFERPEVERIILPVVRRTIPYCFDALDEAQKKAGVKLSDVDAIILAGGSTHIPLVRELVRQNLCETADRELLCDPRAAQQRARCTEPIYDKVDTLVALGAAIRAAAVGGLSVYNPERTVRVSFRGTGATGRSDASVAGAAKALSPAASLKGGRVRLSIEELGYEDEQDLGDDGIFSFRKVPLQSGAENLLTFEVFDASGGLVATAGRPVTQGREAAKPTGGAASTAVLAKAIMIEVMKKTGEKGLFELLPALASLPVNHDYTFLYPGRAQEIELNLYQGHRKIKSVKVNVPSGTPQGAEINLNVNVDEFSLITVKGNIGTQQFDVAVEPPPERKLPGDEEIAGLERKFAEAAAYMPAGKRSAAEARFKVAKKRFQKSSATGDNTSAMNDFEEMESMVGEMSAGQGPLDPPKAQFDELVDECVKINQYASRAAEEAAEAYEGQEVARSIDVLRAQGEKAWSASEQKTYSDSITALQAIYEHARKVAQKVAQSRDTRNDAEKAEEAVEYGLDFSHKVLAIAQAQKRADLIAEIEKIMRQLEALKADIARNPTGVQQKAGRFIAELQQINNQLKAKRAAAGGSDLPEER
jgi:molecular chaperone DnaK